MDEDLRYVLVGWRSKVMPNSSRVKLIAQAVSGRIVLYFPKGATPPPQQV